MLAGWRDGAYGASLRAQRAAPLRLLGMVNAGGGRPSRPNVSL